MNPAEPVEIAQNHEEITNILSPAILQKLSSFLSNPQDHLRIVRIWHPKVVQRSYGKEKRFFCPPPLIALIGPGWAADLIAIENEISNFRNGLFEGIKKCRLVRDQEGEQRLVNSLNRTPDIPLRKNCAIGISDGAVQFVTTIEDEVLARSLFINSLDKRRYFKLSFQLDEFFGPSTCYPFRTIGYFESSDVRVVSKPAKKQTMRSQDSMLVCLKSGMQIGLFNRGKPQFNSTRYLYLDGNKSAFVGSYDRWSCFYIFSVDTTTPITDDVAFSQRHGILHYGHVVRIVDVVTGVSTPNLIIRKIVKNDIQVTPVSTTEPVALLQRVAFQFCDSHRSYWGIYGNDIIKKEANIMKTDVHEAHDTIAWTITTAEFAEFKFYQLYDNVRQPVSPVPQVKTAQLEGARENQTVIELSGINLGPHLDVFFGLYQATVISSNARYIRCQVPTILQVSAFLERGYEAGRTDNDSGTFEVSITLIRKDGIVYPTTLDFKYSLYAPGEVGRISFRDSFDSGNETDENIEENVMTEDEDIDDQRSVPPILDHQHEEIRFLVREDNSDFSPFFE